MKLFKKMTALLLVLCTAICLAVNPVMAAEPVSASQIEERFSSAESIWPDGTAYVDGWQDGCGTCFGFIRELARHLYGIDIPRQWSLSRGEFTSTGDLVEQYHLSEDYTVDELRNVLANCQPGDIMIAANGNTNHGVIIRSVEPDGSGVHVYDANWSKINGQPQIATYRFWSADDIKNKKPKAVSVYRYPNWCQDTVTEYDSDYGANTWLDAVYGVNYEEPVTKAKVEEKLASAENIWQDGSVYVDGWQDGCGSCFGFIRELARHIYEVEIPIQWSLSRAEFTSSNNLIEKYHLGEGYTVEELRSVLANCLPGDIMIATNGNTNHGVLIRSVEADGSGAYVYDANWNQVNGQPQISSNRYWSAENIKEKKPLAVSVYRFDKYSHYLDVNGMLNGDFCDNVTGFATFDVYINDVLVADDCSDYWAAWPDGSKYEITDIKAMNGKEFNGLAGGAVSGLMSDETEVVLSCSDVPTDGLSGYKYKGYCTKCRITMGFNNYGQYLAFLAFHKVV